MVSCTQLFSKMVLFIIMAFFWIASACLIFVGAYVWHKAESFDTLAQSTYTLVPTLICITTGIFLFLLGVIGCFACLNENRCLLSGFFIILLVILIGEVAAASLGVVYRGQVETSVDQQLKNALQGYHNNSGLQSEVDAVQELVQCCGVRNYTDWLDTPWEHYQNITHFVVPQSCCANKVCNSSVSAYQDPAVHSQGCLQKVTRDFRQYFVLIVTFSFLVAVIQILGMLSACILLCRSRDEDTSIRERLFGSAEGLRV